MSCCQTPKQACVACSLTSLSTSWHIYSYCFGLSAAGTLLHTFYGALQKQQTNGQTIWGQIWEIWVTVSVESNHLSSSSSSSNSPSSLCLSLSISLRYCVRPSRAPISPPSLSLPTCKTPIGSICMLLCSRVGTCAFCDCEPMGACVPHMHTVRVWWSSRGCTQMWTFGEEILHLYFYLKTEKQF